MNKQLKLNDETIQNLSVTSSTGLTKKKENEIIKWMQENPVEFYWDYRDKLSKEDIEKIFKNIDKIEEGLSEVECLLYEHNLDYICELEDQVLKNMLEEFNLEDNEKSEDIKDYFRDYISINYGIKELLRSSTVNVVAKINSDYDCINSNWHELQDGGYRCKDSYFKDMLDFLNINPADFKKKVVEKYGKNSGVIQGKFPNLKSRSGKELISIDSLLIELANNPLPGNFIFIVEMLVDDAIEFFKGRSKAKYLKVKSGTNCGLFCGWQGGGSCLECQVINEDLNIKLYRGINTSIDVDVEPNLHTYTVDEVFGLCGGVLKRGGLELI